MEVFGRLAKTAQGKRMRASEVMTRRAVMRRRAVRKRV